MGDDSFGINRATIERIVGEIARSRLWGWRSRGDRGAISSAGWRRARRDGPRHGRLIGIARDHHERVALQDAMRRS